MKFSMIQHDVRRVQRVTLCGRVTNLWLCLSIKSVQSFVPTKGLRPWNKTLALLIDFFYINLLVKTFREIRVIQLIKCKWIKSV